MWVPVHVSVDIPISPCIYEQMCIYVHMHVDVQLRVWLHICFYKCPCVSVLPCIHYSFMHTSVFTYMNIYPYVVMYTQTHAFMWVCVCVHMCMYVHMCGMHMYLHACFQCVLQFRSWVAITSRKITGVFICLVCVYVFSAGDRIWEKKKASPLSYIRSPRNCSFKCWEVQCGDGSCGCSLWTSCSPQADVWL